MAVVLGKISALTPPDTETRQIFFNSPPTESELSAAPQGIDRSIGSSRGPAAYRAAYSRIVAPIVPFTVRVATTLTGASRRCNHSRDLVIDNDIHSQCRRCLEHTVN
jgi:hypothetical protein